MDDIAFSDWPGSPVDLSGSNPWLPAYGYQPPATLLDKDDFLGNPDAALFLQGTSDQHYIFLETIVEETSDDLRSESDRSGSRCSPVGWLATDSESGSVIHVDVEGLDDMDSGSESEMACPAKRRREDDSHLLIVPGIYSDNESIHSLSRSSSLLQFESLEKHCQDIYSSSPSILSFFSQDSLENQRQKSDVSPDSLDRCHSDSESESDYYRSLQIEVPGIRGFRNSLFYDTKRLTDSDDSNSDSRDSDDTLLVASRSNSCKSVNHALKSYRSCESLNTKGKEKVKEKMSAENLSEDSGYSDHFCNYMKKSVGVPNMQVQGIVIPKKSTYKMKNELKAPCGRNNCGSLRLKDVKISNGFDAYDYGECGFQNVASCFGSSYQDLSVFDKYESLSTFRPTVGMRRVVPRTDVLNIALECIIPSKYSMATSTSEPNLLQRDAGDPLTIEHRRCIDTNQVVCKQGFFGESVCVSSVPKDLNFVSDKNSDAFKNFTNNQTSIAAKNWDLCTLQSSAHSDRAIDKMATNVTAVFKYDESPSSSCSNIDGELTRYRREGSYVKAISDYLNMTDIPHEECILNDDPQIQKAVSDSSIRSFNNDDKIKLDVFFHSTPINKRNVTSTPNLPSIYDKNVFSSLENNELVHRSMQNVPRKSSLVDRKDDATGMKKALSSGSAKGVHFCPVVSEVSWRESSTEEEEEEASTNSAESSSTDLSVELNSHNAPVKIFTERTCVSQPELQNIEKNRETEYLFVKSDLNKSASTRSVDSNSSVENKCDVNIEINQNNQVQSCSLTEELDNPTVVNVYKPPPVGHVTARPVEPSSQQRASVAVMDSTVEQRLPTSSKPIKSVKFGSFLSRFTSFRFSGRKSSDDKTRKKSSGHDDKKKNSENSQKIATKEDYIYIPLKGPLPTDNSRKALNGAKIAKILIDGRAISEEEEPESVKCVTAKPPLPKLPPRVVSASVKRRPETAHSTPQTIDHGGGTTTAAAASIRNACSMEPMGLIETDLDTEVTVITGGSGAHVKTRSLMNLGPEPSPAHPGVRLLAGRQDSGDRPHKSMEFLLDKENLKAVEPPENELQKGTGERVMSEHQLRVQRSLQKLTIPDWYKQNQVPREGFILKKHKDTPRWTGTGTGESKTPSLSSLGSGHSPILLSPTPQIQPFTRWSTSKLNSAASSPCASTRSSFNHRTSNGGISPCSIRSSFSYRQPYLGWRSQERLTRPKTPAERLATTILPQNQENPEIQTSIKEVTSAIVHYVSALKPEHDRNSLSPKSSPRIEHKTSPKLRPHENHETGSQKSISPRGSQKLCWLESSFVGTRPLDSPETPVSLTNDTTVQQPLVPPATLRLDLQSTVNNGEFLRA